MIIQTCSAIYEWKKEKRPIEQYVTAMVSVFYENVIKTMSAEKAVL